MLTSTITELRFLKQPAEVPRARRAIRERLRNYPAEMVDDVELCASEIVTNAIAHADAGSPAAHIFVLIVESPGSVRVEVIDGGSTSSVPRVRDVPEDDGGRGLLLVDSLSDSWGTYADDAGRNVWFQIGHS